jgi:anti-sigma B factor antagonist
MDLVLHTSINSSDILIIECRSNNLDASNVRQFKDNIQAGLGEHSKVVLDMSGVKFVDSSGLGGLISCLRLLNSRNGDFRLCNMSTSVRALFELMRMHRVFTILASREDAIRSYS